MRIIPLGAGVGDRLMVTAFVREMKRAWPEEMIIVEENKYPWIWENNPWRNWGTMRTSSKGIFADPVNACFQRNSRDLRNTPWHLCMMNRIEPVDTTPQIFLTPRQKGYGLLALSGLPRPIVAIDWHSMDQERCWPLERFKEVVDLLRASGVTTVEVGAHAPLLGADRVLCRGLHYVQTAAVLAACDLFMGNDSGTFHLAASVGTPQVVMFGPIKAAARAYFNTVGFDDMLGVAPETIATQCLAMIERRSEVEYA